MQFHYFYQPHTNILVPLKHGKKKKRSKSACQLLVFVYTYSCPCVCVCVCIYITIQDYGIRSTKEKPSRFNGHQYKLESRARKLALLCTHTHTFAYWQLLDCLYFNGIVYAHFHYNYRRIFFIKLYTGSGWMRSPSEYIKYVAAMSSGVVHMWCLTANHFHIAHTFKCIYINTYISRTIFYIEKNIYK